MLKETRSVTNQTNSSKQPNSRKASNSMMNSITEFTRNNVTVPAKVKQKLKGIKKGEEYVGIDIGEIGFDKYVQWRGKDEVVSILQQYENIECIFAFDEAFPKDKDDNIIGEYDPEKNRQIIESGTVRGSGKTKAELKVEYEALVAEQQKFLQELLTNPVALSDKANQIKLGENNAQIATLKSQIDAASRAFKPRKKRAAAMVAAGADGEEDEETPE